MECTEQYPTRMFVCLLTQQFIVREYSQRKSTIIGCECDVTMMSTDTHARVLCDLSVLLLLFSRLG